MADHTITADHKGVYEIPLQAAVPTTVKIEPTYELGQVLVQVLVHNATAPVYARSWTVEVGDPKATIVPPMTWADVPIGRLHTLAIISAADATISVCRP